MKGTLALLTLVVSLGAFAQEKVELNSKEVSVDASEAIVVRTNKTPKTVTLNFKVPMENSVCERYETRHVLRTSSLHCGSDYRIRRIRIGRVCVRQNPHNGKCLNWQEQWREEQVAVPRTCLVPETYCAQYGTATSHEKDSMKIQFKDLPALGDSESETFLVKARQKNYDGINVVYDISPLETLREYKVKQKKFLGIKMDSYVVEEK